MTELQFSLKDTNTLHYFLSSKVIPTKVGLFVPTQVFMGPVVHAHMKTIEKVSAPLPTSVSLHLRDWVA